MSTDAPLRLPASLRVLNALGPIARGVGAEPLRDDPDYYWEKAQKRTGLSDFGDFDIRTSLEQAIRGLVDAKLHFFGSIGSNHFVLRNLENQLRMVQAFKDHPEMADVDVESPLIVVCTARTGSTLLHNLLSLHPDARGPRLWELMRPAPPPHPDTEADDPRVKQADREYAMYYRLVPDMRAIHYMKTHAPDECVHLFDQFLTCRTSFSVIVGKCAYTNWIMGYDMLPAYREYKRYLQMLQFNYPGRRLVLKSPAHLLCLRELKQVFPNAQVVQLHRDPVSAAGSFCSLMEAIQISMRRHVDPVLIGETWTDIWTPALRDCGDVRDEMGLEPLDILYQDLVADPLATVRTIYSHFGWTTPPELDTRVNRYLEENPKGRYGRHQYSVARYGLDEESIRGEFAPYVDRFAIPSDRRN